jgi:hypothetical protein
MLFFYRAGAGLLNDFPEIDISCGSDSNGLIHGTRLQAVV